MIKLGGKYDGQMWVGDPTTSRSLETELVSQAAQSSGIWMENYTGPYYTHFSRLQLKNIFVTINRTTSSVSLFIGHMVEQHDSLVDNLQKVAQF